jgi:hypothetical protein
LSSLIHEVLPSTLMPAKPRANACSSDSRPNRHNHSVKVEAPPFERYQSQVAVRIFHVAASEAGGKKAEATKVYNSAKPRRS